MTAIQTLSLDFRAASRTMNEVALPTWNFAHQSDIQSPFHRNFFGFHVVVLRGKQMAPEVSGFREIEQMTL